jgi:hypothetical protein
VRPPGPFPEPSDRLLELAARHGIPTEKLHVGAIPGMEKMSDVISEWAAPILDPLEDAQLGTFRSALWFAASIWNAATMPEGTAAEVAAKLVETLRGLGGPMPDEMLPLVEQLVASRRCDYATDSRFVVGAEAEDHGDDRRIKVVSAVPGPARESTD